MIIKHVNDEIAVVYLTDRVVLLPSDEGDDKININGNDVNLYELKDAVDAIFNQQLGEI